MRIDCEVHPFRQEARRAAPVIDGSLAHMESTARGCAISGLVLVQPAFLDGDPTELFAQASQAQMPVRLIPPLVQPLAPWVLEQWSRSGAVGLAVTLDDVDLLAESLEAALELGFHLEISGGVEGRERLAELLLADGHRLVFRDFGLADSTRDPSWDPRLQRLLSLAADAEVWVKLSGIGRVPDDWAKSAADKLLEELTPEQLLWGSEWPHVMAAHAYAPSYAQTLAWLEELVPDADARGRILGETPAALYGFRS
ncbi:putative TIM-barrel fold metal-dependent hydrolase [Bradyrhizobium macuxiense]|uniref:Putative TIM-barrel fold metal-dependent hydrolase n=1 Tax=Bradyrhizobium macuxiense TaxID=1755647 RepID=A0A560KVN4_9BRAD|nr:amidohydrolase family protein [Bradyrhizobium macuxiense]TWB87293.1 putative TIM-barrel fold metal-dependent hydrolase [Bradyrhizobium macuxiense]